MCIVRQILLFMIGISVSTGLWAQLVNLEAGKSLYDRHCNACHQIQTRPLGSIPLLNSQLSPYLLKELLDYQSGKRQNPIMTPLLQGLSMADLNDIIAYTETGPKLGSVPMDPNLYVQGAMLYRAGNREEGIPACAACHSPDGSGNSQAKFPRLAGQNPAYIEAQLKAFKTKTRVNDPHQMMQDIAAKLSDQQIQEVASYVGAQDL